MKLKFIKAEEFHGNAKATVHSSGKLGFSTDAATLMSIGDGKYVSFAQNEENSSDKNLYAVVHAAKEEGGFKISKAGDYYYINSKGMFDLLDIDYQNRRVIFDIVKIEHEGMTVYKLIKREKIKKNKTTVPT